MIPALLAACANVVLVTWDGVRPEDFFDKTRLPRFWAAHAASSLVSKAEVANPHLFSLPGYESIFAGAVTPCASNRCGRVDRETFPERIRRELHLQRESVAAFASWERLGDAVEHVSGAITVDAGSGSVLPWSDHRDDAETVALAMDYLRAHRPRFLYIGLGETDDRAHDNDLRGYREALARSDGWLDALFAALDAMGDYGKDTTVIVTTDHGRGEGPRWTAHGAADPHAREIWLLARGAGVKPGRPERPATHLEIRPTIENLFGLRASGAVIDGIAPISGRCPAR